MHDLPVTHLLNVGQGQIKWASGHKTQVILILSSTSTTPLKKYGEEKTDVSYVVVDTGCEKNY